MSEASRAAEYRRMMTARALWEREQRFTALPGDEDAKVALDAAWEPVADKDRGWDPSSGLEGTGTTQRTALGPRKVGEGRQLA